MTSPPYTPTSEFDTSSIAPPTPPKVISSEKQARKVRRRKPAQDLQDRLPEGLPRDYHEPLEVDEPEYDISDYAMPAPSSSSKPRPRRHAPSSNPNTHSHPSPPPSPKSSLFCYSSSSPSSAYSKNH
ncbi:hypothetical protein BDZ91DRAFT_207089 [Kalaharituber pfeilii]|nr:hypothetical protein BDZ91DRAFT_207089 [Kalaharituber pfeilii]